MICNMAPLHGGKILISYVDITDMKDRETELADALEKSKLAEAVINGVRDPVFVKDSELKFVIANRAFSSMFGLEPEAMVGKSDRDFFPARGGGALRGCRTAGALDGRSRRIRGGSAILGRRPDQDRAQEPRHRRQAARIM